MLRNVTINSLPQAMEMVKQMMDEGFEDGDYRGAARDALVSILEDRMASSLGQYLAEMESRGEADRKNGYYSRHLLTELGDIELRVPRTRTYSAQTIVKAYARRAGHLDRAIMAAFILGVSTRKVAEVLSPIFGEKISPSTVSRVAKALDVAVAAYHQRSLARRYAVLIFDAVMLSRKTGAGAIKRPVLVALGIRPDGKEREFGLPLGAQRV